MRKVPDIDAASLAFGEIGHLPAWKDIPDAFKKHDSTYWNKLVSDWFFSGLTVTKMESLIPRTGVDKIKALKAIHAILRSWDPKHEHKEAGAAFLMSEWFLNPEGKV